MSGINNNYSNSEALLKRLQMKNLMDGKKEEVQELQQGEQQEVHPASTCSENNAGSLQALDYQALLNSTLVKNTKVQNVKFNTYTLSSNNPAEIEINGEKIAVTGKGCFEIAIENNNVIIKAGKNASSIKFNNTKDLNITVEKSNAAFNLTTGAGNDTVIVAEGAKVKNIITGSGDDVVIIGGQVTQAVKTGEGDDTVINLGSVNDILGEKGDDVILNKGTVKRNINGNAGDDIIQNDGTVKSNIYGETGADSIVNNKTVKGKVDAGKGVDVVIDGNTVKFEKAANNITLGENDTAVIKEDDSVSITTTDEAHNKQIIVTYDKTGNEIAKEEKPLIAEEEPVGQDTNTYRLCGIFPISTAGLAALEETMGDVLIAVGGTLQSVPIIGNAVGSAAIPAGTSLTTQATNAIAMLTTEQARDSVLLHATDGVTYLLGTVVNGAFTLTPLGLAMWLSRDKREEAMLAMIKELRNLTKEQAMAHFRGTCDLSCLEETDDEQENENIEEDEEEFDDIDTEH